MFQLTWVLTKTQDVVPGLERLPRSMVLARPGPAALVGWALIAVDGPEPCSRWVGRDRSRRPSRADVPS